MLNHLRISLVRILSPVVHHLSSPIMFVEYYTLLPNYLLDQSQYSCLYQPYPNNNIVVYNSPIIILIFLSNNNVVQYHRAQYFLQNLLDQLELDFFLLRYQNICQFPVFIINFTFSHKYFLSVPKTSHFPNHPTPKPNPTQPNL